MDTQQMLGSLAERLGLSKTEVVELAIRKLADSELDGKLQVDLPPGLRRFRLSEENAQTMQRLLDDPAQLTRDGKEMPTADASVLLKRHTTANP